MILIIDDDAAVRASLTLLLKNAGFVTGQCSSPGDALSCIRKSLPEVILLDMNFSLETSGREGLALLGEIKRGQPSIPVILMTAWGSIALAVEGMRAGAADFFTKPWNNDAVLQSVRTAISLSAPGNVKQSLSRARLDALFAFENIIGEDPKLMAVLETVGRISATDASVLILGESGTGKELIAEAIHQNSERRNNPFVKVNLGGISSSLFESELFGHMKGAFTDAKFDRTGRFELAETGTIFLDEIGDLDYGSQVKLLRVLQDRSYEPLGSSRTKTADVRVISATNKNLKKLVGSGEFREDLYYRVNLITLELPPLRERPGDIALLANRFIDTMKTLYRREHLSIDRKAMNWLKELPWPGNVRELKNLVERTVLVTSKDTLGTDDFLEQMKFIPPKGQQDSLPALGVMTLGEIEENMIRKAMEFYGNNISKVARVLGVSRTALYRRMDKYGITA